MSFVFYYCIFNILSSTLSPSAGWKIFNVILAFVCNTVNRLVLSGNYIQSVLSFEQELFMIRRFTLEVGRRWQGL